MQVFQPKRYINLHPLIVTTRATDSNSYGPYIGLNIPLLLGGRASLTYKAYHVVLLGPQ